MLELHSKQGNLRLPAHRYRRQVWSIFSRVGRIHILCAFPISMSLLGQLANPMVSLLPHTLAEHWMHVMLSEHDKEAFLLVVRQGVGIGRHTNTALHAKQCTTLDDVGSRQAGHRLKGIPSRVCCSSLVFDLSFASFKY
jgi:hypothetical protein